MNGRDADALEALKQAKADLRRTVLARRETAGADLRARASHIITQKLLALPAYHDARCVAAYASFGSELDTSGFLARALADGKQLLLPRINRVEHALELRQVADLEADLVAGVWGIREPTESCPLLPPEQTEFMLVPGVAFAVTGARLGYGGGFYDRLLARLDPRAARIAGAFQLQLVDELPEGPRDQRVQQVITELAA